MKNTNEITNLTIKGTDLDFWTVADLINTLSGIENADNVMMALEDWRDENAAAFAEKYANEGLTEAAETILGIYDGDLETDPDSPCYDPDSIWTNAAAAIKRAKGEDGEKAAPVNADEILEAAGYEKDAYDYAIEWLDNTEAGHAGWDVVEEAARIHSVAAHDDPNGHNLFVWGRIYGMATALATAAKIEGADADFWADFISTFAADNYENGARIE